MYEIINKYKIKKLTKYDLLAGYDTSNIDKILTKDLFEILIENNEIFLIIYKKKLLGFFTLMQTSFILDKKKSECIQIEYLHITDNYTFCGLEMEILKDIQWVVKNFRQKTNYILLDTSIAYSIFYLDRGFNLYKIKKDTNQKKVTLYKEI